MITSTIDDRLKADEQLNAFGIWCENSELPTLADGIVCRKVRIDSLSGIAARYADGAEDHQILLTLTYEVI